MLKRNGVIDPTKQPTNCQVLWEAFLIHAITLATLLGAGVVVLALGSLFA